MKNLLQQNPFVTWLLPNVVANVNALHLSATISLSESSISERNFIRFPRSKRMSMLGTWFFLPSFLVMVVLRYIEIQCLLECLAFLPPTAIMLFFSVTLQGLQPVAEPEHRVLSRMSTLGIVSGASVQSWIHAVAWSCS